MTKQYYIYIMTNKHDTVLYTGMTNNLKRRAYEHRTGRGGGFTSTLFIDPKEDMFMIGACQVNGGPPDFWAEFQRLAYMSLV